MTDIFISYRTKDEDYAGIIDVILRAEFDDKEIFLASESIEGGTKWKQEIDEAIVKCTLMLVIIGAHWQSDTWDTLNEAELIKNDWVVYEIHKALKLGKPILPISKTRDLQPANLALPKPISELNASHSIVFRTSDKSLDKPKLLSSIEAHFRPPLFAESGTPVAPIYPTLSHPPLAFEDTTHPDGVAISSGGEADANESERDSSDDKSIKRDKPIWLQILLGLLGSGGVMGVIVLLLTTVLAGDDPSPSPVPQPTRIITATSPLPMPNVNIAQIIQPNVAFLRHPFRGAEQLDTLSTGMQLTIINITTGGQSQYLRVVHPNNQVGWILFTPANVHIIGEEVDISTVDAHELLLRLTEDALNATLTAQALTAEAQETATAQYTPPTPTYTPTPIPTFTDTPTVTPIPTLTLTPSNTPTRTPSNEESTATATTAFLLTETVLCANMRCQREYYTRADVGNINNLTWEFAMDYCVNNGGQLLNQLQWQTVFGLRESDSSIAIGYNFGELLCDGSTFQCNNPQAFNVSYVYFPEGQNEPERTIEGFDATLINLEAATNGPVFRCAFPIP